MKLQNKTIETLKEMGIEEGLWLVEVQTIEECANFYGNYVEWDLCKYSPNDHTHIIYYHESESIHQHATFNPDDQVSFKKAVEWIAEFLGVEEVEEI